MKLTLQTFSESALSIRPTRGWWTGQEALQDSDDFRYSQIPETFMWVPLSIYFIVIVDRLIFNKLKEAFRVMWYRHTYLYIWGDFSEWRFFKSVSSIILI
ncbi:MAG: hypothetical protein HQ508_00495 [Candidatus Marinimicrobia bacterium]|nr:hypothetical protein [Candidatus Neomarinimicrobiota bacterium]